MSETLRCPKCGHGIDRENPVCPGCGAKLKVRQLKLPETPVVRVPKKALAENEARLDARSAEELGFGKLMKDNPGDPFSGFSVLKGCAGFLRFCQYFGGIMIALLVLSCIVLSVKTYEINYGYWGREETSCMTMLFGDAWVGWVVMLGSTLPVVWMIRFSKTAVETIGAQIQAARKLRIIGSDPVGTFWYRVGIGGALGLVIWGGICASEFEDKRFWFWGCYGAMWEWVGFWFMGCLCRLQAWSRRFAQKCLEHAEADVPPDGAGT